jgi:hypothetical protein
MAYQIEFTVVGFVSDTTASPQRIEDRILENLRLLLVDDVHHQIEPTVFGYVRNIKVTDHSGDMPRMKK